MQEWKGTWGSDGPIFVGDLNADGKTDVFMWRDSTKTWTVNLSTGTGFSMQEWKGAWGSDGPIFVGDLNGDGKTDVFMWRDSTKTWTVNLSTGTGFSMQEWKGMWGSDGPIHVGDLNGDGKTDVFMWRDSEKVWSINVTQPPSPLRPLDLSYKATDLNGYPLNPVLLEQVNHPVTGKTLAKHIYDLECIKQLPDNGDLDDTHWNAWYTGDNSCTHYPVTKTTGNLLFGHVNFMPVAITGKIKWNDHSTDDGDYNLWIASTNNALGSIDQMLPDLTTALVYCEFDSDEAIDPLLDNVDEDDPFWWKQFKNAVDSGDPALLLTNRDGSGKEVIAIGLYSLDCCHPCEVELHPLYIMAIHVDSDPRADRWALLAFNKGNQGYCGGDRIGLDSNNGANAYYNGVDEQYSVLLPRPACSAGSAPVFTHKDVRVVLGGGKPIDAVAPKYFDSTFLRGKGEKLDFRLRYPGKQNDDDHYVIMGDITLDWGENEVPY